MRSLGLLIWLFLVASCAHRYPAAHTRDISRFHQGHVHPKARMNYRNIQRLQGYLDVDSNDDVVVSNDPNSNEDKKSKQVAAKRKRRRGNRWRMAYFVMLICGAIRNPNAFINAPETNIQKGILSDDHHAVSSLTSHNPIPSFEKFDKMIAESTSKISEPFTQIINKVSSSLDEDTKQQLKKQY